MGAMGRGNAGISVELLHLAIEIDPENWHLWYLLGLAYKDHVLLHNHYERAVDAFLKASTLTNVPHEKAEIYTSITIVLILMDIPVIVYQFRAVELEPDNPHHWAWLGQVEADVGKWYEARDAWMKALDLDPNHSETLAFMTPHKDTLDRLTDYPFEKPIDVAAPVAVKPKFGFPFEVIVTLLEVHRGDEEVCQHHATVAILMDGCSHEGQERKNSIFEAEEYVLVKLRYHLGHGPSSGTSSLYPIIDDFTFMLTYKRDSKTVSGTGLASSLRQGTYYAAPGESVEFWELHLVPRDIEKPRLSFHHDRRTYYFTLYDEGG